MISARCALLFACSIVASAASMMRAAEVTATATWDSNVTNANRSSDVVGALALRADATGFSRRISLGRDDALLFSAGSTAEVWPRFDGLDRITLGPQLAWQHKFGLGALAPVFSIDLSADGVAARESDRSGWAGQVRLAWRRRWEDGTQLVFAYDLARHDARGTVFDRAGGEAAIAISRDLTETWRATIGARWRDGDVLSYATPPRPDLVALARVRTLVDTFGAPRIAYSLSARSLAGAIGLTRALDDRSAFTVGYEARTTERAGLRYVNHLVSTAFSRQF